MTSNSPEQELVEYIARHLVNDPDQVRVELRDAGSTTILELHVAQGDMGRVIGKNGRVANAIRSLLRAMAKNEGRRVILEID
jgi:hypothetical protein